MSRCSNAIPAPRATANSGSAASLTGMPVSARILSGNPTSKEPPPARVMPRSMMSADNSGGVLSRVIFTASTMEATGSSIASRISTVLITTGRGSPVTKSRPQNSALCSSRSGVAEPKPIFSSSTVLNPVSTPYSFFRYCFIAVIF